jgi:hypothetical protein
MSRWTCQGALRPRHYRHTLENLPAVQPPAWTIEADFCPGLSLSDRSILAIGHQERSAAPTRVRQVVAPRAWEGRDHGRNGRNEPSAMRTALISAAIVACGGGRNTDVTEPAFERTLKWTLGDCGRGPDFRSQRRRLDDARRLLRTLRARALDALSLGLCDLPNVWNHPGTLSSGCSPF